MTTTSSPATTRADGAVASPRSGAAPAPHTPAPLLRRLVARALDMFTVLFVSLGLVLLGLAPVMASLSSRLAPEPWGEGFAATMLYGVVALVYEVTFLSLRGQTPGKDVCQIAVVVAATGANPGWLRSLARTLPLALLRLTPGAATGTAMVLVTGVSVATSGRRALHDLLAGTVVIVRADDGDDPPTIDEDDLHATYGPRGWWVQIERLLRSGRRPRDLR